MSHHRKREPKHEPKHHEHQIPCCTGDELFCISAPSPITVALLGRKLTLELPCLKVASEMTLTGRQASQLLKVLIISLKTLSEILTAHNRESVNEELCCEEK